jgi:hypothetical protein
VLFRRSTTRRFVAWLALFAMWLAAAAPTVSRVLPAADAWPELGAWCTGHGLEQRHPEAPADPAAHLDKCGYCALLAHSPLLGAPAALALPPALPGAAAPAGRIAAAGHAAVPLAAHPRGPPPIRPA